MENGYNSMIKWFSIMHRLFQMYANKQLKAYNLNSSEFLYLLALFGNQKGMSHQELANELHLDNAAVTRSVKSLEGKGFVYWQKDPDNHRIKRVFLTEKGFEFLPKLRTILDAWDEEVKSTVDDDLYDLMTDGVRTMTKKMLDKQ